jgi:hypothetical protein
MSEEAVEAPVENAGSLTADMPTQEAQVDTIVETKPDVNLNDLPQWLHEYKDLGPEVLAEPSLKLVDSNEKLLKGYVNAQKAIGANKVVIPNKHAEWNGPEWSDVFYKLGLPDNLDSYEVKGSGDAEEDEFIKMYKEVALKERVLPQQAQAIYNWYKDKGEEVARMQQEDIQNQVAQEQQALRDKWGDKYDRNLQLAQIAVRSIDDAGFLEYLEESGLATNAKLIEAFSKLGQSMHEEAQIIDGDSKSPLQSSKDSATQRLSEIYEDPNNPIYHKSHPAHERARQEVRQLHLRKNM